MQVNKPLYYLTCVINNKNLTCIFINMYEINRQNCSTSINKMFLYTSEVI